MKTAILLLSFLILSCSVTEPEVEEILNLKYIYQVNAETGLVAAPRTLMGVESMVIAGKTYTTVQCDYIKATIKGDDLIWWECFRYGKYYSYDYDPDYKYYWGKK